MLTEIERATAISRMESNDGEHLRSGQGDHLLGLTGHIDVVRRAAAALADGRVAAAQESEVAVVDPTVFLVMAVRSHFEGSDTYGQDDPRTPAGSGRVPHGAGAGAGAGTSLSGSNPASSTSSETISSS